MKVLMVYPSFPDTFWGFRHALRFISRRSCFPPLGLLTVASLLPQGWEKRLVDMNCRALKDADILWADYVFISAMSVQKASVDAVLARCRRLGAKVVAGGPLFTVWYDDYGGVDHLVLGEAEVSLPLFLADLASGDPARLYPAAGRADMEAVPVPQWDLIRIREYASMNLQYSRGCPFDCEFCDIVALYGRRSRTKQASQVVTELESLYAAGWRGSVFFVDDNFTAGREKLKQEVLPAIRTWMDFRGSPFSFFTEASIDLADDDELVRQLVDAGFTQVFVGIETPNEKSLAECGKSQNTGRDLIACVQKLQQAGLQVQGGFIVGFDSDPDSIFDTLIRFIQRSGIVTAMVGLLNAPRGTRLYRRLEGEGRLLDAIPMDNTEFTQNFVPVMDPGRLIDGYKKIVSSIYSPGNYYRRIRAFFDRYRPQRSAGGYQAGSVLALLRSMVVLGIFGRERRHYWRLFFWCLFRRARLFPTAITLAIYGYHFRRIFDSRMGS
jgi:radical SAM superfamily enzyme YgiQ (UPF0313 family)